MMKNNLDKVQIITAILFLLLYFNEGKASWVAGFYLPMVTVFTAVGMASPILDIFPVSLINSIFSVLYLTIVFASPLYVLRTGTKSKQANTLSILAGLFMFSFVFWLMFWGNNAFGNILSIISVILFTGLNSMLIISGFRSYSTTKYSKL